MTMVDLREAVLRRLRMERPSKSDAGVMEVVQLAHQLGVSSKLVAVACSDLARVGKVDGDGNMMGFVRISDAGIDYVDAVEEMEHAP